MTELRVYDRGDFTYYSRILETDYVNAGGGSSGDGPRETSTVSDPNQYIMEYLFDKNRLVNQLALKIGEKIQCTTNADRIESAGFVYQDSDGYLRTTTLVTANSWTQAWPSDFDIKETFGIEWYQVIATVHNHTNEYLQGKVNGVEQWAVQYATYPSHQDLVGLKQRYDYTAQNGRNFDGSGGGSPLFAMEISSYILNHGVLREFQAFRQPFENLSTTTTDTSWAALTSSSAISC